MSGVTLYDYQQDAVSRMKTGCILCGGVGSGKSRTALAYFYQQMGGQVNTDRYVMMRKKPLDLYIITTAHKRDTCEWEDELAPFLMTVHEGQGIYDHKVVIDSWNNIQKYADISGAFFIFDEQRAIGYGKWSLTFIKIAKHNEWILASATPGDTWMEYMPVFVANGFYRNKTDFVNQHVIYNTHVKFRKIDGYVGTRRLERLRDDILVNMDFVRPTMSHHTDIHVFYDRDVYKTIGKERWNPFKNEPLRNASELCSAWRHVVNGDVSRLTALLDICLEHPKVIIFYNYNYELDILKGAPYVDGTVVAQWNGHEHEPVPTTERWVYLVQYTAGCEGWNCTTTDTMIFYSQNYSYKVMTQAAGRIDRLNTPFKDLYYYHLKSSSPIDRAIADALKQKKNFNEKKFTGW